MGGKNNQIKEAGGRGEGEWEMSYIAVHGNIFTQFLWGVRQISVNKNEGWTERGTPEHLWHTREIVITHKDKRLGPQKEGTQEKRKG